MIRIRSKGDFKNTEKLLKKSLGLNYMSVLEKFGQQGVEALSQYTPIDTGETASSWSYIIEKNDGRISIVWCNSHVEKGVNVAVILQYGHGTRTGGWVEGTDYINPALKPIFDKLADAAWKEVTKL